MAPRKQNPPRDQHFLARIYQSGFVNERGLIYVLDTKCDSIRELHPKVNAKQKDNHTINHGSEANRYWFERVLSRIEGLFAEAKRALAPEYLPSIEHHSAIHIFMAWQAVRVPAFQAVSERYARAKFGQLLATASSGEREGIEQSLSNLDAKQDIALPTMKPLADKLMADFAMRKNTFVWSNGEPFVTCDNPVTVFTSHGHLSEIFGVSDSTVIFPLTSRCLLLVQGPKDMRVSGSAGDSAVSFFNSMICANRHRFVYAQTEEILQRIRGQDSLAVIQRGYEEYRKAGFSFPAPVMVPLP